MDQSGVYMRTTFTALAVMALAACTPATSTEKPAETAAVVAPAEAAAGPIPFSINVTVSAKAIEKMAKEGDQVRVSATYFGKPKPGVTPAADPSRVSLGDEEEVSAPASWVAKFSGAYDVAAAKDIDGEPRVLINAVSTDIDRGKYPMECT